MLNVAILSGWHVHAEGYANDFKRHPEVNLSAIWDEDPDRGRAFAQKFDIEFVSELDELLARKDIDAVSVTTPTNIHRDVMVKAANAGKHIFTEKVLALTHEDAVAIKEAVERNKVKFCISFPYRTSPSNLLAKKIVEENILGDITLLRVRNAHNGASAGWLPPHFYDETQCGGGAMMDLGAHPMYLIHWLMGMPTEISSAFTAVTGHAVEDNAVSIMKFANGAIAISETGFVSSASPFALELYGTEGSLLIGLQGVRLYIGKNKGEYSGWVAPEKMPKALSAPIPQFVAGVLHDEPIFFSIDDAVALTDIMEAAYISHREGRHVAL